MSAEGVTDEQIFDMLMQSQFWSAAQMLEYQRSQLAQLLRHAKAHVPFYKTRLDCVLRYDGSIDWDRWSEIPIVTRADLRDRGAEMRAIELPPNQGNISAISSSGSTGVPITIHSSEFSAHVYGQSWRRLFVLHGMSYHDVWAEFRTLPADPPGEIIKMRRIESEQPMNVIRKVESVRRRVELLAETKAIHLVDSVNHAEIIARENLRAGKPVELKTIVCIGMGVTDEQRKLFVESFGANALSPYSSKEGGLIAFQCPQKPRHFHINSELLLLEAVDEQNRIVTNGVGRSIITPFFNTVQPLIRYDQGDYIEIPSLAFCQSRLPSVNAVQGRVDSIFRFPAKEVALTAVNTTLVQESLDADAFQIAQTEPLKLEVRYVSQKTAAKKKQALVAQHLLQLIGLDVSISFHRINEIKPNAGGKQQRIVREFDL